MLQQRFLDKVVGLIKSIEVFVKSMVYLLLFYLFINVLKKLV
jgi:hypothetical protein